MERGRELCCNITDLMGGAPDAPSKTKEVFVYEFERQRQEDWLPQSLRVSGQRPDANIPKLMDWVDKFAGDGPSSFPDQRAAFRRVIENPDNNWYRLIKSMWTDIDDGVRPGLF